MRKHQPLTALRAFEAVARLKSISLAADELHVTRPAVSKQVTLLEQALSLALLVRSGNAIALTEEGVELQANLSRAFDLIATAMEAVQHRNRNAQRLRLLVCRDFAASWLSAHIGAFLVSNAGISVEITSSPNGDFRLDEDFDVRIFYGLPATHRSGGLAETELCRWIDLPVCTKAFAETYLSGGRKPADAVHLIDGNYDVWEEWCAASGIDAGGPRRKATRFNETTLCLSVAAAGGGLTIGDSFLTFPAIQSGQLTVPYPFGLMSAQSYSLFRQKDGASAAAVRVFETWLHGAIEAYQARVLDALQAQGVKILQRA